MNKQVSLLIACLNINQLVIEAQAGYPGTKPDEGDFHCVCNLYPSKCDITIGEVTPVCGAMYGCAHEVELSNYFSVPYIDPVSVCSTTYSYSD